MEYLTDGQRFARFRSCDRRVRGPKRSPSLSQASFEAAYEKLEAVAPTPGTAKYHRALPPLEKVQVEHWQAQKQHRRIPPKKTAILVAANLDESVSFVERARFVLDHAPRELICALESDDVSFHEAWIQTKQKRKLEQIASPKVVPSSPGEVMIKLAGSNTISYLRDRTPWTREQRVVVLDVASALFEARLMSEDEVIVLHRLCGIPPKPSY